MFASSADSWKAAPDAKASTQAAMTVSPAPLTSNTSRARVGTCRGAWPRDIRNMPCGPSVMARFSAAHFSMSSSPAFRSALSASGSSFAPGSGIPAMAKASRRLGVATVMPRRLSSWPSLGSSPTGIFRRPASARIRSTTSCVTVPLP